jgi:hypothetical protein
MPPINGAGFLIPCQQKIDQILRETSEFDKLASAAGATIVALIPLVLSISGPPTANVAELYLMDERFVSFLTAGLTFGMPAAQERSHHLLEANNVSDQDILRPSIVHTGWSCRYKWLHRSLFAAMQLVLSAAVLILNGSLILGDVHPIWVCSGVPLVVVHIGLGCMVLVVGLIWFLAIHCNYRTHTYRHRALVIYPSSNFEEGGRSVIAKLLSGFARSFVTILLTFVFGSVYGASLTTALIRVSTVAAFVFCSRALSIWYARSIGAQKIFVTYENENEKKRVVQLWRSKHPSAPATPASSPPTQQAIPLSRYRIPTLSLDGADEPLVLPPGFLSP